MSANHPDTRHQVEELREQQRAVSGVLRAVARSAGLQPVLDEVVDAGRRLCGADYGALYLLGRAIPAYEVRGLKALHGS